MARARRIPTLRATATLALSVGDDGALPTEFRLFTAGWNKTANGDFLFDAQAASATMAAYKAWGIDRMIDLEHQSLSTATPADPTARDARGWCRLELRPDGSLWAVGVTWTEDGAARLTQKRQRYVSPAFGFDTETRRVESIINVAIVAIPATHDTPALMAATGRGEAMTIEEFLKVCKALEIDPTTSLDDAMAKITGGAPAADPSSSADVNAAPDASGEATAGAVPATPGEQAPPEKPEKKAEVAAASARLMRLTGAASFGDAVDMVSTFRESHVELEKGRAALAADRAVLESAERRKLCVELVTLGAEFPSTVWADDKQSALKSRWLKTEIAELRAHVAEQRQARKGKTPPAAKPPAHVAAGESAETADVTALVAQLSARELQICKDTKCEPSRYALLKAQRDSVKTEGN